MKALTKEFMINNCGCYSKSKLMEISFMKNEGDSLTLDSIIHSEIPLKDKFWFLCRKLLNKEQNQQLAILVAEIVLPIYENKYSENKAPREAIEAAKLYLKGHISLSQLLDKRRAAYAYAAAAYAAADAAYAAYAAAYAAYAAADAAYAYAAAAAAADADAAAAAAYAAYAYKNALFAVLVEYANQVK